MARKKFTVNFEGFAELAEQYDQMGADIKEGVEEALKATHDLLTPAIQEAMRPHKLTGETAASIVQENKVNWEGNTASIKVGFDFNKGGLTSIFLMYDTKIHGTPRKKPADKKLYNASKGEGQYKKKIKEMQKEAFLKAVERSLNSK